MRPGRYCIRLSRVLINAVSCPMSCLVRLASDLLRFDQTGSTGFSSLAYGGSRKTLSHERAAELLVRGVQEAGVAGLGEPLCAYLPGGRGACGRSAGPGSRAG